MNKLFQDFDTISEKEWKNKVQVELKGLEYNETLVWGTNDQINVKPLYTKDDVDYSTIQPLPKSSKDWKIISKYTGNKNQDYSFLYGYLINQKEANSTLDLPNYLDLFIQYDGSSALKSLEKLPNLKYLDIDPYGYLAQNGLWQNDSENATKELIKEALALENFEKVISIQGDIYQNAGANHVQQIAITLAHAVEYLENFGADVADKIYFKFAVGSNYFFEVAKLRAFRFLWKMILEQYNKESEAFVFTSTSDRNKSKLDIYNNVIRSTVEASSAIFGSSDAVFVGAYDELNNESDFGLELAAKQQLLLQKESYLNQFADPAAGSFYIETLTNQMAENALELFKTIQTAGGFIKALQSETIQDFIYTSAKKEQKDFDEQIIKLIGVNKFRNPSDVIEKMPKEKIVKPALFIPIVPTRLAEKEENK
ncbi:methylmalonyl-CoA mutase family protein [Empedobacter stercoris]|uniref:Methylmalonyl-CoA mutase family protein n=1 Tax=Empedobacter falsenii TaxID=343874 RepID=A0ABY8V878_9FLAO|nr:MULTISPECIES: methylmalonyl-CoA mutase family protein [Empedobacter]MCA4776605.1 methylmalonyl-CoA mutase [Empedobacter stercoris]MDM1523453.1 methylmalonyl-CoA mutase [Empedobacter sp. 225-1]MDM1543395.1 methylmalonyl-CoA mutase [Empedobacter sp. 189-2]UWX67139.1 methylmalonyl-CoA mutase family protein [Empedobacter stercoris]WIH97317.1 methylmalonyl-CoA mutase family protein [Empedobacter falsenii]